MLTYLSFLIVALQLCYDSVLAVRRIILNALSYCIVACVLSYLHLQV